MSRIPAFKRWVTTNVNIWMTMLLGGLWHGAGWNFVIWGGLNGLGITVYKLWRKVSPWESKDTFWKKAVAVGLTFHFITFTRIWFRSASHTTWAKFGTEHNMASEWDTAMVILSTLATGTSWDVTSGVLSHYALVFAVMLLGYVIHLLPSSWKGRYRQAFVGAPLALQAACAIVAVTLASAVLSAGGTPFIYFQF